MAYGIGIDTGGTYTDAVIYDFEKRLVIAKSKSPTTRSNLEIGIGKALDLLPADLLKKAESVALSTTLATNACVENKGGRARLVLMGTNRSTLEWIGADKKYGLNYDEVLCLDTKSTYDGKVVDHPEWDKVTGEHTAFFSEAEALSVAELNSLHNGAVCEITARDFLKERFGVPVVMASDLANEMNVMERGTTALLNARLLPVVDQFMKAVGRALTERGVSVPQMIVRSDGSLMNSEIACLKPVETILSGPAASVRGSGTLSDCENCLIVDMGGTTTDISIVRGGAPQMTGGINIGGWRTQIKGVFIDTFGLGGDTRIYMNEGELALDVRRVEPVCFAASKWPQIKDQLRTLLSKPLLHTKPLHEFLYLVNRPLHEERYSDAERRLIETLSAGPQMIGGDVLDRYSLNSERLEQEGIVMRCGLTPTDAMHIKGDYACFDAEASRLVALYFVRAISAYEGMENAVETLSEDIYNLVKKRLFENIARVFIEAAYPKLFKGGISDQMTALIADKWARRNEPKDETFFDLSLNVSASLIGLGAPTHIFLPDVAKALGTACIIPEHSEVANAVGAAVADISVSVHVEVRPDYGQDGVDGYTIHAPGLNEWCESYEEAVRIAGETAERMAGEEARRRGASGSLSVQVRVDERRSHSKEGIQIDLGTMVTASATGRAGV